MKKNINIGTEFNLEAIQNSDLLRYSKDVITDINENNFASNSENKKTENFNIELHSNDIVILDLLAKEFGLSRSKILTHYLTLLTEFVWKQLADRDMSEISIGIDKLISQHGLKHKYKDKTWELELILSEVTEMNIEASYERDDTIFGKNSPKEQNKGNK